MTVLKQLLSRSRISICNRYCRWLHFRKRGPLYTVFIEARYQTMSSLCLNLAPYGVREATRKIGSRKLNPLPVPPEQ